VYDNVTVNILGTVYSYVNCFFKYENEYSGNSLGSIVIVLYLCWPGMFENKYFDQWSSEHSLYYTLMEYLMDKECIFLIIQ
jgi:hypothetical protein